MTRNNSNCYDFQDRWKVEYAFHNIFLFCSQQMFVYVSCASIGTSTLGDLALFLTHLGSREYWMLILFEALSEFSFIQIEDWYFYTLSQMRLYVWKLWRDCVFHKVMQLAIFPFIGRYGISIPFRILIVLVRCFLQKRSRI